MIIVALPYLITEVLTFESAQANRLYGFAEGALAAGGLAGGIYAGIFSKKLSVDKAAAMLTACAISIFPMGIALMLFSLIATHYTSSISFSIFINPYLSYNGRPISFASNAICHTPSFFD